jgi:hypothetical protein
VARSFSAAHGEKLLKMA